MRVVRRDPNRTADVLVEAIGDGSQPTTARAVPHPHHDADPPSSSEMTLEPLNEAVETVHTAELLLDAADLAAQDDEDERTPVTSPSPWQRQVPPPLPESER